MRFSKYNFIAPLLANFEELGFKRPTDIQFKTIPPILSGEDVLAIAQTGTGKTAAYAIPVIQLLCTRRSSMVGVGTRCVVMVPTHELAIQVAGVFRDLMKDSGLLVMGLFGGVDQEPQINQLKKGVDVVVATPGRLFDLSSQGHLALEAVEILIMDEADHMLELGFYHDMLQLVHNLPKRRQTLFFSATIDKGIKDLAYGLVSRAVRIQISPKDPVSKNIDHSVMFVEMDDKRFFLENIVKGHPESKILVFVRTKVRAERVVKAMGRVNIAAEAIHGDKEQSDRTKVLTRFRTGENKVLVATDVSARGIDIPDVEYVVNYDLPEVAENYVHRVGRTGRGTHHGIAVSFCSTEEKAVLDEIEAFLDKPIAVIKLSQDDYETTIDLSPAAEHDWKSVVNEMVEMEESGSKKRKKKKKK
jgi:ATP-dependent RNA helicase RhlE